MCALEAVGDLVEFIELLELVLVELGGLGFGGGGLCFRVVLFNDLHQWDSTRDANGLPFETQGSSTEVTAAAVVCPSAYASVVGVEASNALSVGAGYG